MTMPMPDHDPPAMPGELDHYGSMAWCEIYRALSAAGQWDPELGWQYALLAFGAGMYCGAAMSWSREGLTPPHLQAVAINETRQLVRTGLSQLGLIEPEAADLGEPTRDDHLDPVIADLCGLTSTVH